MSSELKLHVTYPPATYTNHNLYILNNIPVGTGVRERIGRKVSNKSLKVDFTAISASFLNTTVASALTCPQLFRVLVYLYRPGIATPDTCDTGTTGFDSLLFPYVENNVAQVSPLTSPNPVTSMYLPTAFPTTVSVLYDSLMQPVCSQFSNVGAAALDTDTGRSANILRFSVPLSFNTEYGAPATPPANDAITANVLFLQVLFSKQPDGTTAQTDFYYDFTSSLYYTDS